MSSSASRVQPPGGVSAKSARRISAGLFAATAILDFFLFLWSYHLPNNVVLMLAYQYAILLPAAIWFLYTNCAHNGLAPGGHPGRVSETVGPHSAACTPAAASAQTRRVRVGRRLSVMLIAAVAFTGSAIVSRQRAPGILVADEQVYHFEAELVEHGRLRAAAPPEVTAAGEIPVELRFNHNLITPRGWTGMYPIGWPLVLAAGEWIHAPWLVTPLLGAILVLLTARLGRIAFDRDTGLVAAVLLVGGPFFFVNTSGLMSHALAACLVTAALCLIEAGMRRGYVSRIAAGLALVAVCFLVRPFTCAAAGGALAVVLVWRLRHERLAYQRFVLPVLAVGAFAVMLYLIQNKLSTGNFFVSAYALSAGARSAPEITFDIPVIVRRNLPELKTSVELTVFYSAPFLFLLAAWAFAVKWRTNERGTCSLLACVFAGSVLLYILGLPNITLPGQRMYFEGMPGLAVLAASGLCELAGRWRVSARTLAVAAAFLAIAQIAQSINVDREITARVRPWATFKRDIDALPLTDAVVFMKADTQPGDEFAPSNFNPNEVDWRHAPKVYLMDPGPERREQVAKAFHRRRWAVVVYAPSNGSFRIEASGEVRGS